jgi:hypothetical protein
MISSFTKIIKFVDKRRMRWTEHMAHMGGMRNSYKILARKFKVNRPFSRHGMAGENIKMGLM